MIESKKPDTSVRIVKIEYRRKRDGLKIYDLMISYKGFKDHSKETKKAILDRLKEQGKTVLSANWKYQTPHLLVNTTEDKRLYVIYRV